MARQYINIMGIDPAQQVVIDNPDWFNLSKFTDCYGVEYTVAVPTELAPLRLFCEKYLGLTRDGRYGTTGGFAWYRA